VVDAELLSFLVVLLNVSFNLVEFFAVFQHSRASKRVHLGR
jgi:hypothetical protein